MLPAAPEKTLIISVLKFLYDSIYHIQKSLSPQPFNDSDFNAFSDLNRIAICMKCIFEMDTNTHLSLYKRHA